MFRIACCIFKFIINCIIDDINTPESPEEEMVKDSW